MPIAIAIVAILVVAAATVLVTANRRSTTARLDPRARRRDRSKEQDAEAPAPSPAAAEDAAGAAARARADEARRAAEGGVPAVREPAAVQAWEPIDEEELGVTRRQFFNRGIVAAILFATASLGASVLAFIWPSGKGGFGGKIPAGNLSDILAEIASKKAPYYVPQARAYVVPYPQNDVERAVDAGYPDAIVPSLEEGYLAVYQKCPHLGCRVPWCQTSQWFECPCHGSKYNRVGEKRGGPAPRGMSLIAAELSDDRLVLNTGLILPGMPIGTDTTEQQPEGPACV